MFIYLTKVLIISGFYAGCTGIVMGHNETKEYYVMLTCISDNIEYNGSEWIESKDLRRVSKRKEGK